MHAASLLFFLVINHYKWIYVRIYSQIQLLLCFSFLDKFCVLEIYKKNQSALCFVFMV